MCGQTVSMTSWQRMGPSSEQRGDWTQSWWTKSSCSSTESIRKYSQTRRPPRLVTRAHISHQVLSNDIDHWMLVVKTQGNIPILATVGWVIFRVKCGVCPLKQVWWIICIILSCIDWLSPHTTSWHSHCTTPRFKDYHFLLWMTILKVKKKIVASLYCIAFVVHCSSATWMCPQASDEESSWRTCRQKERKHVGNFTGLFTCM